MKNIYNRIVQVIGGPMIDNIELQDFEAYKKNNPFMDHNNIEIVEVSEEKCTVRVDIVHESHNLHGYIHGGLLYSMADVVCGIQSRVNGDKYVTQSSHINFLRNITEGTLYCSTDVVKRGRTMVIIHFQVKDENDKLLADGVMDYIRRS